LGSVSLAPGSSINVSDASTASIRGGQFVLSVNDAVLTTAESPNAPNTFSLNHGSSIVSSNAGDAGSIRIRVDESIALVDSTINSNGTGAGNAGLIWLTAPTIALQHGNLISLSQGLGNAGNILLEARALTVGANEAGAESTITAETGGSGRGGDITIHGLNGPSSRAGDITISGASAVTSTTSGGGRAGDINVMTDRMTLTDGGAMVTSSGARGHGGNMKIDAGESVQISSVSLLESSASGIGNAGHIIVITPTLTLNDGGVISTSTTASGNAGTITIKATSVNLLNGGQLTSSSLNSAPPESSELPPAGNAGDVTIEGTQSSAQSILIDGVDSGIFTDTLGVGTGGDISVKANSVTLQNSGTLSAKTSGIEATATGGSITVKTTDHVSITNGASITASSTGIANAGNISINAGQQLDIMGNSSVETKAEQASGGNIDIHAIDRVRLVNSSINTSVFGGAGNGGDITIDPNVVVLQHSQVIADAFKGVGGDITITTPVFLKDSTSKVSAFSPFGLNGTVTIQSPTSNLSESLGTLPSNPSQAHSLLTQRCAALANGQTSSFIVAGRGQLPADPGGWLTSPFAFAALGESLEAGHAGASAPAIMAIAAHDAGTVSLRRLTPAGFLMANFADSEATGCQS
jgi:large exoprotein involved in heme utilization and adhesion